MNAHQRAIFRKDHELKTLGVRARTEIPLLRAAIEQLKDEIESLKADNAALKARLG